MSNSIRVYINTQETKIGTTTYNKGDINGTLFTTTTDFFGNDSTVSYGFGSIRNKNNLNTELLGVYEESFKARVNAHKLHYMKWYKDCIITVGAIKTKINNSSGYKNIGCFVAVTNDKVLLFEAHFAGGGIAYATGKSIEVVDETFQHKLNLDLETESSDFPLLPNKLGYPRDVKITATRKRLQPGDKKSILGRFKMGYKGCDIAKEFNISAAKVSLLKKEFKKEGLL